MTSTQVGLSEDERYPTYSLTEKGGTRVDVSTDALDRWRAAIAAYNAVQAEMGELFAEGEARDKRAREIAAAERAVQAAQVKLDALKGTSPAAPGVTGGA